MFYPYIKDTVQNVGHTENITFSIPLSYTFSLSRLGFSTNRNEFNLSQDV